MTLGQQQKRGWRRHLDGWELAGVLVLSAVVSTLLAVPHATVSRELPLPAVDRAEQRRAREQDASLALKARQNELPYETRAVGEALRRYGAVRATGSEQAAAWSRTHLHSATQAALQQQQQGSLLVLRAVQLQLFLAAVRGPPSAELNELGGEWGAQAEQAGWLQGDRIRAHDDELRAWFLIRWGTLTKLSQHHPFTPTLNEWRTYYAFLLRPDHQPANTSLTDVQSYRSRVITALARHDPDYPVTLAQGILSCQQGDYAAGAEALRGHLRRSPNGPWTLRAQSTLKAATAALHPQRL